MELRARKDFTSWQQTAAVAVAGEQGPKRREAAKVLALTASRGVSSKWLVINMDACAQFQVTFFVPVAQKKYRL
jgi:hypothetical protein